MEQKIFIAFLGNPIGQNEKILEIQDGYECWNLKKFNFEEFISALQNKIPPINETCRNRHYRMADRDDTYLGTNEEELAKASWGLLIPECTDGSVVDGYNETLFLLNLYSPVFFYPAFHATNFGIMRGEYKDKNLYTYFHDQDQTKLFARKEFVEFFKKMLPQGQYGGWQLDRSQSWDKEDWRLFTASYLFGGLHEYENSKSSFDWPRETAEMAIILESLFTAGDTQSEEVTYRLKKRIAALLSHRFPDIENEIRELYKVRSGFVHGSFFAAMARDTRVNNNQPPVPNFEELYKQKEYVRSALVAYLNLNQCLESTPELFNGYTSVIKLLEDSIINVSLREKVVNETTGIFALMS